MRPGQEHCVVTGGHGAMVEYWLAGDTRRNIEKVLWDVMMMMMMTTTTTMTIWCESHSKDYTIPVVVSQLYYLHVTSECHLRYSLATISFHLGSPSMHSCSLYKPTTLTSQYRSVRKVTRQSGDPRSSLPDKTHFPSPLVELAVVLRNVESLSVVNRTERETSNVVKNTWTYLHPPCDLTTECFSYRHRKFYLAYSTVPKGKGGGILSDCAVQKHSVSRK
jgi:hypothetical protein